MAHALQQPNRDDISPCMVVIPGEPLVDDSERFGPLICIPFHAKEEPSLPKQLQEALWVFHSAMCPVHQGEKTAFMDLKGRPFHVRLGRTKTEKPIIVYDDERSTVHRELDIQIRVYTMGKEQYMLLVVRSHIAFSLRHAIIHLLTQIGLNEADELRAAINRVAMRVREHLGTTPYNELEYTESIDWLIAPNDFSFHTIFSVMGALEWIRTHYAHLHPGHAPLPPLEGFGDMQSDDQRFFNGQFLMQASLYERKLDELIFATHQMGSKRGSKKRGTNHKRQRGGQPGSPVSQTSTTAGSECNDENEADALSEKRDGILSTADLCHTTGWVLNEDDGQTGLPKTDLCVKVVLRFPVKGPLLWSQFSDMVHMLPTTAAMRILQTCLNIDDMELTDALLSEPVDNEQFEALLHDRNAFTEQLLYSNSDDKWARGFGGALNALDASRVEDKFKVAWSWVKMAFSLASTRAAGSNTYKNARVNVYGARMKRLHDVLSDDDTECMRFFREFVMGTQGGRREGCLVYEALVAYIKVLQKANHDAWQLRPDNLFLLIQIITSDLMLAMNFHGGVVGGAENGIGGTLIVHDGGGAYRCVQGRHQNGTIFTKNNGCGADFVISVAAAVVMDPAAFDPRIEPLRKELGCAGISVMQEVKRSSEMGLFAYTCNVLKGSDDKTKEFVSRIIWTCRRLFTTEMRLHQDAMSAAAIQAIVTSVPRMTRSNIPQTCMSTAEDKNTKTRVPVKYIQVIVGYLMICTNNLVGAENVERVRTLCKVIRGVMSCADPIDARLKEEDSSEQSIKYGEKTYVPSGQHDSVLKSPRCVGIFLTSITVAHYTAFMQWTGMLGKLPMSPIAEEVLDCFYAQLDLSQSLLNRDKFAPDDRTRCFEVSKARVMATSLLMTSIQSVFAVGRLNDPKKARLIDATERNALRLMFKGLPVSMLPWLMADTMEHMFRTDFMILMQYLAKKLGVPLVLFDAVLEWLRTGNADHCRPLAEWLDERLPHVVRDTPLESQDVRAQLRSGLYLLHPQLCITINPLEPGDARTTAAEKIGAIIYQDAIREFQQYCQMRAENGEGILRYILGEVLYEEMAWPSVFGTGQTLPNFWFGAPPPGRYQTERLMLAPLRLVRTEANRLYLCADIRWLLLVSSIAGNRPCQACRHTFVSTWIRHFYKWCMPRCFMYSETLVTGLPSPKMGFGILTPPVIRNERKILGRPKRASGLSKIANSPTGMVEDIAVVEERYQMARFLGVPPDAVPTESVDYAFPLGVWVPAACESDASCCVSVCFQGNGRFRIYSDQQETDASPQPGTQGFLEGRFAEPIRPLCFFDRPGVLLFSDAFGPAVILRYDHREVGYVVRTAHEEEEERLVDPVDMERLVAKIGQQILIRADDALLADGMLFVQEEGERARHNTSRAHVHDQNARLLCTLRVPDDDTLDGLVPIYVRAFPNLASAHLDDMVLDSMEDDRSLRAPPFALHVTISQVLGAYDAQLDASPPPLFHGMCAA